MSATAFRSDGEMVVLNPCPFCGGSIDMEITSYGRSSFSVTCHHCEASGPIMPTMDEAIEAWGRGLSKSGFVVINYADLPCAICNTEVEALALASIDPDARVYETPIVSVGAPETIVGYTTAKEEQ